MRRMASTALSLIVAVCFVGARPIAAQPQIDRWVGTWSASLVQPAADGDISAQGFTDQTVRMVVRITSGGTALRVRLSNTFGTEPLTIAAGSVGLQGQGAGVAHGTMLPLTFGAEASVTIPVGADAYSDSVGLAVSPGEDVTISLYVSDPTGPATRHRLATATTWVAQGDHATDEAPAAFTTTYTSWFWLSGIAVASRQVTRTVACLGDSITDGFGSIRDQNTRYPDFLARRLLATAPHVSVLNSGIDGNRILNDGRGGQEAYGIKAVARFDRDVLTQPGVTDVILLEGINDIGFGERFPDQQPAVAEIIAGMRNLISRAHVDGLRIYGGTLTPFRGFTFYYTEAAEAKRQAVNDWIRTSGEFDAVIDFDAVLRDEAERQQLRPEYDSGDHIHPNAAGYNAMADAVDVALFGSAATQCTCDRNADGQVTIDELVDGVKSALSGCE